MLLLTAGDSRLARALAPALGQPVRLVDAHFTSPAPDGAETLTGDLRDPAFAAAAVQGVSVVIHLAPIAPFAGAEADALDTATRGSYHLVNAAREAGVRRFILGSTLDLFAQLPSDWRLTEAWRPHPALALDQLRAWLAERSVAANTRRGPLPTLCLRLGRVVDDAEIAAQPFDPLWLHLEDALHGVQCALAYQPPPADAAHWRVFHLTAPGPAAHVRLAEADSAQPPFGYAPTHALGLDTPPPPPDPRPWQAVLAPAVRPARPIRKVVVFGAGGPLGAVTARELAAHYQLHLTDARPIADIMAEAKPQMPGAPLPTLLDAPHTYACVDVRDPAQVLAACEGMDAIINCAVVRWVAPGAFQVNVLGMYHLLRAAQAHGLRRLVHTGPFLVDGPGAPGAAYVEDYEITEAALPRPFDYLYHHTKYLSNELARVFADQVGLEIPTLLFAGLTDPALPGGPGGVFTISWADAARAVRRALEISSLPHPFEVFHVAVDRPQRKFDLSKLQTVLGWQPRDRLDHHWRR